MFDGKQKRAKDFLARGTISQEFSEGEGSVVEELRVHHRGFLYYLCAWIPSVSLPTNNQRS